MKVKHTGFSFEVGSGDLQKIQKAISVWKKDQKLSLSFGGSDLYKHLEAWKQFVEIDWEDWDISEYNHDIGCRAWLQLAIEYSSSETASLMRKEVNEIDDLFKAKMTPKEAVSKQNLLENPFKHGPYFWEINTIYGRVK